MSLFLFRYSSPVKLKPPFLFLPLIKFDKRSFSTSSQRRTESFIGQLSAHLIEQPIQPLSYTSTVILITLLLRSTITLPISIWSRIRTNRFESIVIPKFKKFRSDLAIGAKRNFLHSSQIPLYQTHLQSQLEKELKRLISEYKCKPSTTILISIGVHVPVIYTLTTILREACQYATPTSPLTLEKSPVFGLSLIEPDLGLAFICWAGFLINIELNANFRHLGRSTEKNHNQISTIKNYSESSSIKNSSFISRGLAFWNSEKIRSASFLAGIAMMGLSSSQPALVVIYWLTSNCFSILQSLCFIYIDDYQKKSKAIKSNLINQSNLNEKIHEKAQLKLIINPQFKSKSKTSSSLPPIR